MYGELTPEVTEITLTYEGKIAALPVTVNEATVIINNVSDTGLVEYLSSYSTGYTDEEVYTYRTCCFVLT